MKLHSCWRVAVLLLAFSGLGCSARVPHELTLFHLNDLHARLLPDENGQGGFAHLATLLSREKETATAHLTLHAGDLVQGSPVSTLFEGLPIMEVTNLLGIDVHCLGNHEFDYGWRKILEYVQASHFDTVSANTQDEDGNTLVDPYVIRRVGDLRVAVVGALTEMMPKLTVSDRLGPWKAMPLVEALKPVVAEVKEKVDLILVLGHLDRGEAEKILRGLPEVTLVIQGHDHDGWEKALDIDGRIAVNTQGYGQALGRLDLRYDARSRRLLSYRWTQLPVKAAELAADADVLEAVEKWETKVSAMVDVPIGRSTQSMSRKQVRWLIERAMREWAGADIAHMNYGGVRDPLPEGELLARHIWNIMPFDNRVVTTEVLGRHLIGLRNHSGGDLVAEPGSIDPERTYRFVTSDFLAKGWIDQGIDLDLEDAGILLRDLLIEWVQQRRVVP